MYYSIDQGPRMAGHKHRKFQHAAHAMSLHRAPVNIFKTDNSYQLLVFAPGRKKELFNVSVEGKQLRIVYQPESGASRPDWVRKEYSRGWFERIFTLDEQIDASKIWAEYVDGVLQVTLPWFRAVWSRSRTFPFNRGWML